MNYLSQEPQHKRRDQWFNEMRKRIYEVINRFFAFVFSERIFKSIRKFCFELRVSIFKFFDAFLKFKCLMIANIHSKLKFVNPLAEIVSLRENTVRIFTVKKNTEFLEGTIRAFDMFRAIILSFLSHRVFLGKVKQNPTMQTRKLSATDYLIIVYNKIIVKARDLNKLQEVFANI